MGRFAVILPAAGKSRRFKDPHYRKPYAPLDHRAVWLHSAEKFLNRDDVGQLILVVASEDREAFFAKFAPNVAILGIDVVLGGETRVQSVRRALEKVKPELEWVAVHDAARPCLADEWIDRVFAAAQQSGAALLALPVHGTLKRVVRGQIAETIARRDVWEAQTPQVFRRQLLVEAYGQAGAEDATDDAQLVERLGHAVRVVEGSPLNLKITTKGDLRLASVALKALPKPKGLGPAHPFAEDMWR